jgi:hypothetical protein
MHKNQGRQPSLVRRRFGFSEREVDVLSRLTSPEKIQKHLDNIGYDLGKKGDFRRSPRVVMKDKKADCFEGALFAAAALRFHGYPPVVVDLAAVRDDDHVLAVFRRFDHWGAVAKSKYTGLEYREPIHRNIRELALSYFENYFNLAGEKTLRRYSKPVNLAMFDDAEWMITEKSVLFIAEHLAEVGHTSLLTRGMIRNLDRVACIQREAGELGMRKAGLLQKVRASAAE